MEKGTFSTLSTQQLFQNLNLAGRMMQGESCSAIELDEENCSQPKISLPPITSFLQMNMNGQNMNMNQSTLPQMQNMNMNPLNLMNLNTLNLGSLPHRHQSPTPAMNINLQPNLHLQSQPQQNSPHPQEVLERISMQIALYRDEQAKGFQIIFEQNQEMIRMQKQFLLSLQTLLAQNRDVPLHLEPPTPTVDTNNIGGPSPRLVTRSFSTSQLSNSGFGVPSTSSPSPSPSNQTTTEAPESTKSNKQEKLKCPQCARTFTFQSNLTRHMKEVHSGFKRNKQRSPSEMDNNSNSSSFVVPSNAMKPQTPTTFFTVQQLQQQSQQQQQQQQQQQLKNFAFQQQLQQKYEDDDEEISEEDQ